MSGRDNDELKTEPSSEQDAPRKIRGRPSKGEPSRPYEELYEVHEERLVSTSIAIDQATRTRLRLEASKRKLSVSSLIRLLVVKTDWDGI